ncbi:MAG: ATP synthase subunit I [Firmicutes bacterium]|nr:ATP synthase subunit I [Bacillota bacterium]MBS4054181.1 ATP synthase subunit I [Thermaerobacter sp.]
MNDPLQLERELRGRIIFIVLALSAASLLFAWQASLGLLLGGVGAIVYLRLLVLDVHSLTRHKNPLVATRIARRAFAKRMFFIAAVMVVPFFNPWFNFAATVIGVLTIKMAIYLGELVHVLNRRHK